MVRGKRSTSAGSDARSPRGLGRAPGPFGQAPDDEPPSGVVLRCDALRGVPRLAVSPAELKRMPLDHRAGFILSLVDGRYTLETILDVCAMPREQALAILRELVSRGVIVFDA